VTSALSSTASCHCRLTSLWPVEVATTSCASYVRLTGHCLKMRVKHWTTVAWTTATPQLLQLLQSIESIDYRMLNVTVGVDSL